MEINYVSPELMQERYRNMHRYAIFADITPEKALEMLHEVFEGYDNDFDKARAARDVAKQLFQANQPDWREYLALSAHLLDDELDQCDRHSEEETRVLREQSATYGMYAHLVFEEALIADYVDGYAEAVKFFRISQEKIEDASGDKVSPDQYEINMAARHAMAERYDPKSKRGLRQLGRAAVISCLSESRFARHTANLPIKDRYKARTRSIGRVAQATKLVVAPDWYIKRKKVRRKAVSAVA